MDIFKAQCGSCNDASSFILTSRVSEATGGQRPRPCKPPQEQLLLCAEQSPALCLPSTKELFHTELLCPVSLQPASLGTGTHTALGPQCCLRFRACATRPGEGGWG